MIKKVLMGLGIVFIVSIILVAIFGDNKRESNGTSVSPEQARESTQSIQPALENKEASEQVETATAQAPSQKSYQQIFAFSGTGVKKSEPFTVTGSRFKIKYECSGGYCGAYLYSASGGIPQVIMNAVGSIKDETIMYGSGEYYIEANTGGTFTMMVEDYK